MNRSTSLKKDNLGSLHSIIDKKNPAKEYKQSILTSFSGTMF